MQRRFWPAAALALFVVACSDSTTGPGDIPGDSNAPAWTWQNPLPFANPVIGIEGLGDDRAILVTSFDAMETRDGGETWTDLGLSDFYLDIHRSGDVISLLDIGRVLVSEDLGRTWRATAFHGISRLAAAFRDADTGIVVGSGGDIVTTTDGGATWTERFAGGAYILRDVAFYDSQTIFAVGSGSGAVVLRSENGGENWSALDTDGFVIMHVVDIVGGAVRVIDEGGYAHLSSDLGETWTRIPADTRALYDMDFVNPQRGVTAGFNGDVLITVNGGVTWQAAAMDLGPLNAVSFVSDNELWAAGNAGRIYRSTDSGATWTPKHSGLRIDLRDVSFANADFGIAVGPEYYVSTSNFARCAILITTDGGRTWNRRQVGRICLPGNLNAVHVLNTNFAAVAGDAGSLFITTDGGETWEFSDSETDVDLLDIAFFDESRGIAVGEDGMIRVTHNGGDTWTQQVLLSGEGLNAVAFFTPDEALFAGNGGTVFRTTDGGDTWSNADSGIDASFDMRDIAVLNDSTAVMVGRGGLGVVYRTTDGGTTWIETDTFGGSPPESIAFAGSRGYIVGHNGTLRISDDGGLTWERGFPGAQVHLLGVAAPAGETAVVVGDDGAILRTTTGGR